MRILYITPIPPSARYSGTGIRLHNTLRALASCGEVTLISLVHDANRMLLEDCHAWCRDIIPVEQEISSEQRNHIWRDCWNALRTLSPSTMRVADASGIARAVHAAGGEDFDVVWAAKGRTVSLLGSVKWQRVVVDLDDLESRVWKRILQITEWYPSKVLDYLDVCKQWVYERRLCTRAARVLVCSEKDRRTLGYTNVHVLPNCVDVDRRGSTGVENPYRMLLIGLMSYGPNVDAALFFCREIFPYIRNVERRAHVYIVGREPVEAIRRLHTGDEIIVTGAVPDVIPYFNEAGMVVVPLRAGGGTRVKILEAFAHRKAVVSTSLGAEGLDVEDRVHFLRADTPAGFAAGCVRLMADAPVRRALGAAGRHLVESRYSEPIFQGIVRGVVDTVICARKSGLHAAPATR